MLPVCFLARRTRDSPDPSDALTWAFVADLATRLLNHQDSISRLLSVPSVSRTSVIQRQRSQKLSADEIDQLVERYRAGESTHDLAAGSTAHCHTIARALTKAGVELGHNRRRLTDAQVHGASQLYDEGWSLAQLADHFGVGRETHRRELSSAGTNIRRRGGRT